MILLAWHALVVLIVLRLATPPKFEPPAAYRAYMAAVDAAMAWQRSEYERRHA